METNVQINIIESDASNLLTEDDLRAIKELVSLRIRKLVRQDATKRKAIDITGANSI